MSTQTIAVLFLLLAAVMSGVLITVFLELRKTLRVVRKRLDQTGRKVDVLLDDVEPFVRRLTRVSKELMGDDDAYPGVIEKIKRLSTSIDKVRRMFDIASAVGTAIGPAITAFFSALRRRNQEKEHGMALPTAPRSREDLGLQQEAPSAV